MRKHYLKSRSVTPRTLAGYDYWYSRAEAFCGQQLPRDVAELDRLLEPHLNELYFGGELVYAGKQTLAAVAFHLDLNFQPKDAMVRCKRALKGWRTAVPERSRDPCPWVALALVCEHLSSSGDLGLAAARAAALQMDGYFRPSEVLAIRRCDVAQHSRSAPFAITVAPSHGPGVEAAAVAPPRAKSGQYDDTVLVGDKTSLDAGRPWTRLLVRRLLTEAPKAADAFLFAGLTLAKYEALFRSAVEACRLQALGLTPHMLRHGGPSEDILNNVRSISQVQERGRWSAPASVRNYQKQGRVLRQLNKMSKHQQRLGRAALAALPRWLRL